MSSGYVDGIDKSVPSGKVKIARFVGNTYTDPDQARLFSRFRAIESCREQGQKIARTLIVLDRTKTASILKTSSQGHPIYSWNGYYRGSAGTSTSWTETFQYPTFDTFYFCKDTAYRLGVWVAAIEPHDAHEFTRDTSGAVSIESLSDETSLSARERLRVADIITKVNDQRVTSMYEFIRAIEEASNPNKIKITLFREGTRKEVVIRTDEVTDVLQREDQTIVDQACSFTCTKDHPICQTGKVGHTPQ